MSRASTIQKQHKLVCVDLICFYNKIVYISGMPYLICIHLSGYVSRNYANYGTKLKTTYAYKRNVRRKVVSHPTKNQSATDKKLFDLLYILYLYEQLS